MGAMDIPTKDTWNTGGHLAKRFDFPLMMTPHHNNNDNDDNNDNDVVVVQQQQQENMIMKKKNNVISILPYDNKVHLQQQNKEDTSLSSLSLLTPSRPTWGKRRISHYSMLSIPKTGISTTTIAL
jgi:hypothetical protein